MQQCQLMWRRDNSEQHRVPVGITACTPRSALILASRLRGRLLDVVSGGRIIVSRGPFYISAAVQSMEAAQHRKQSAPRQRNRKTAVAMQQLRN
jgi:hypothetical protein